MYSREFCHCYLSFSSWKAVKKESWEAPYDSTSFTCVDPPYALERVKQAKLREKHRSSADALWILSLRYADVTCALLFNLTLKYLFNLVSTCPMHPEIC